MAPAYRTPAKGITLPNGNRLNFGQLFPARKEEPMLNNLQRKLNSAYDGRTGAPKKLTDPAIVHGQTRREEKGGHSLLPGRTRPLDDEPMAKTFLDGKSAPINPGTSFSKTRGERGTDKGRDHGSLILQEASRSGRAP